MAERTQPRFIPELPRPTFYQALFGVYILIALLAFTFLVPPFEKSDEPFHWYRTVSLTNLDVVCAKDEDGRYYTIMKRKYADLPADVHAPFGPNPGFAREFSFRQLDLDFADPRYREETRVYDVCNLAPYGYLPSAVGVLLGKPFENPLISFYLGRMFGALFFVGAMAAAIAVAPQRYKLMLYFYAAVPTLLHHVTEVSYDAMQLPLYALLFAYLARLLDQEGKLRPRQLLILVALIWWVVNIRTFAYYGLALLFFLLPWRKVADRFSGYLRVSGAFLGLMALTTGVSEAVYLRMSGLIDPGESEIHPTKQVEFVLRNPLDFVAASYRAVRIFGNEFLQQFFGVFGWLDYELNAFAFYVCVAVLAVLALRTLELDRRVLGTVQVLILWTALALIVVSLFFALYVVWTPVGGDVVLGIQGRYFLGLLPFALLAFNQTAFVLGRERFVRLVAAGVALFILASILFAILGRYY